ncbi:MAG: hypothetical protein ABSA97_05340 [Verrucomicrobiia bacterium]
MSKLHIAASLVESMDQAFDLFGEAVAGGGGGVEEARFGHAVLVLVVGPDPDDFE